MNRKQLLQLIEEGEGLRVEFKQRFSDYPKMAKEMIALANTKGGYIIIGIDDDKSIYGVMSEKGEAELIKETTENYCEPPINYKIHFVELEHREIVVVEIPESTTKPHRIQDYLPKIDLNTADVFIRVNDKSVPASKEMIKILEVRSSGYSLKKYGLGKIEKIVFDYLQENDFIIVKELSELSNVSNRRASRALINLVRIQMLNIHTKDNGEDYFSSAQ